MNGFFQINTYYNEFKQEVDAAYAAAPIQQQTQQQQQQQQQPPPAQQQHVVSDGSIASSQQHSLNQCKGDTNLSKNQRRFLHESDDAREKRLARNAERMRQKRAMETEEQSRKRMAENAERMRRKRAAETEEEYRARMERNAAFKMTDEYRRRLIENAERNRRRRQNETELERSIRRARSAARERLRRAMETPEQRAERLAKLAERMRYARANETPEQRANRLAKNAARARQRFLNESPEQWIERKRKKAEYARQKRAAAAAVGGVGNGSVPAGRIPPGVPVSHASGLQQHTAIGFPGHAPTTLPETILHTSGPQQPSSSSSASSGAAPSFVLSAKDISKGSKHGTSSGSLQSLQPEQIYSTPQVILSGGDFKPHELLNGQHLVMQTDANYPSNLYKLHILPYPFPTSTASGTSSHMDQTSSYKTK